MPSTVAVASQVTAWSTGAAHARLRTVSPSAVAVAAPAKPRKACPPAAAAAAAAPPSPRRRTSAVTSRRDFLAGVFKCSAAGASLLGSMDELAATPLSRSLSSATVAEARLPRHPSGLPRTGSGVEPMQRHSSLTHDVAQELASSSNVLPLSLKPLSPLAGGALRGGSPIIAPPEPRLLQLQSTAELEHMVVSHTRRLLVVSFALNACPFGDALLPWLAQTAQRHPDALFLRLAIDAAADDGAERLLSALSIGTLPVTQLLACQQLLARLEAAGGRTPDAAAHEAALELHSALMAAKAQARLQHADCAPHAAAAPAPCLVYA